MEGFLLIIHGGPLPEGLITSKVRVGMRALEESGARVEEFADQSVAIAVQQRDLASDTYIGQVDNKLFYVQGWVEPLEEPVAPGSVHQLGVDKAILSDLMTNEDSVAKLTGSFHIVAYDRATQEVAVFVDRLASRPIFYTMAPGCLILSSDIRAVLGVSGVDCSLDMESLVQFVRIQTILGDRTLYREIRTLLPGTVLRANSRESKPEIQRYWAMNPLAPFENDEGAILGMAAAFQAAGRRYSRGTMHGGVLLSGGLDSRLVLAVTRPNIASIVAVTFGPALTDEGIAARAVARSQEVPWHLITQTASDRWEDLDSLLPVLQGQYALTHTHPFRTARRMAALGVDTIYHGLELCVTFSGSYLPKNHVSVMGRTLYDYRLAPLSSPLQVKDSLLDNLDIQSGSFENSLLRHHLKETWDAAARNALGQAVDEAAERWEDPYDWYEKALLSAGFSKFRSYSIASCNRAVARERSLMPDSEVIDAYLRLSVRQRYLGPLYRKSLHQIDAKSAQIPYANTGISAFAPPFVQGLAMQTRQLWRANRERARCLLENTRFEGLIRYKSYGSYPFPAEFVQALVTGTSRSATTTREALRRGFLAQNDIIDVDRLNRQLDSCSPAMEFNQAQTILALASLAAWFEKYPAKANV